MNRFLLDTSVLIDLLRGHPAALGFLEALAAVPACSEITRVEVLRGMRSSERPAVEALFEVLDWVAVDEVIARRAGHLGRRWRRSYTLSSADLVIAATVDELGANLATGNVRHFPMFEGLQPPY